ncbi:hypothetical protein ACIQ9J_21900 [Streptomyces sp. NPDC094153]|uniref:hypothetical protein n=1 Tax=Streptomyces sp. NPDC094153 TaxID=3366058 RepID=UPI00382964CC
MKTLLSTLGAAFRDVARSLALLWRALPELVEMKLANVARSDRDKVIAAVRKACLEGCDEASETGDSALMAGAGIVADHVSLALLATDRTNTAAEDIAARRRTLGDPS